MNVLIITDLEGISGVDKIEMVAETGTPGHEFALKRLMLDVNAAVEGAIEGGAESVYVVDGHGGGNNFIKELLDPRAIQVKGAEFSQKLRDGEIHAYMAVGAHAMAGTINGFLDHTQSSKSWYNYIVNGRKSGELAQGGIFAGAYGVPVVMVTGDEAACVEAKAFFGNIECAVVKYGIGRNLARLVDLDEALNIIRKAACDSMKLVGSIKPYKPLMPLDIRLELYRSDMCDEIMARNTNASVERLDARTVRKVVHKVENFRDILF